MFFYGDGDKAQLDAFSEMFGKRIASWADRDIDHEEHDGETLDKELRGRIDYDVFTGELVSEDTEKQAKSQEKKFWAIWYGTAFDDVTPPQDVLTKPLH